MSDNITWQEYKITTEDYEKKSGHQSAVIWLTGLSGSGKSTIANALHHQLFQKGCRSFVLDGDNIRHGLNNDLGFSEEDRAENIRRIGEVAKLFAESGTMVITAFISPYRKDRNFVRSIQPEGKFVEVYVKADLEVCKQRDPKGLYKKAKSGEIRDFTGVSSPYEEPERPELMIDTTQMEVQHSVNRIFEYLTAHSYFA